MWVRQTSEDMERAKAFAEKNARSHGLLMAGPVWLLVTFVGPSVRFLLISQGIIVESDKPYWPQVPFYAAGATIVTLIVYRIEKKRDLRKSINDAICPKCDGAREGGIGTKCACGGEFVPLREMKWVEDGNTQSLKT
jgi:hypothetical protein